MLEFMQNHQLNIMLALCGACGICAVFVLVSHTFTKEKKRALFLLEVCAMGLLLLDRCSAIFDGDTSQLGWWMNRISNFFIFFLSIAIVFFFNLYLESVIKEAKGFLVFPKRLKLVSVLCLIGGFLVIVSQFTGLYYTFDDHNVYQRAPGFLIAYIVPVIVPILQLSIIVRAYKKLNKSIRPTLVLYPLVPLLASMVQMLIYGVLLTDIALAAMSIVLYVFALREINDTVEETRNREFDILMQEEKEASHLFDQIITAFVSAVDAKDPNRKGHASRVARYARQLAEAAGKNEEECEAAYLSALLHDVGKISLPDKIVKKRGKLTLSEQKIFDQHATNGRNILEGITEFPYLKDAAGYHHEWYDGSGFPGELSGEDIPEYARLVAVANDYDDMSSISEDRDLLPQQVIREEIVKESGKRYDPVYAKAMLRLIDSDKDYRLRQHHEEEQEELENELVCGPYRVKCSIGIPVGEEVCRVTFRFEPEPKKEGDFSAPAVILFDAMDGRVHTKESSIKINRYIEFGEIWFDGHMICTRSRDMKLKSAACETEPGQYRMEVVRVRDHARVSLTGEGLQTEVIVGLPDSSGNLFVSLTGENGRMTDIQTDMTGVTLKEGDIPRIVDEVTYIDRMVGDVPNIQIDSYISDMTEGRPVTDGMEIVFHTMTLPSANMVWHCPFLVFFKSDDKHMYGPNYDELAIVRLDGESVESGGRARSMTEMREGDDFESWDAWKEFNKKGFECTVRLRRFGDRIIMQTENAGISVKSTIYTTDRYEDVCVAITGDQCALTDIRFIA